MAGKETKERSRSDVERLGTLLVVASQLEEVGANAVAGMGGMDLAFAEADGDLVGLRLFDEKEVAGVVIAKDKAELATRLRRLGRTDEVGCLLAQGARVVGMTEEDLAYWLAFYKQAVDYYPVLGRNAWEQSGLRRFTREEAARIAKVFREILQTEENKAYLKQSGATKMIYHDQEKRDAYIFVEENGKPVSVVLRNVRTPEREGVILKETVSTQEVVGVVIPQPGEDKIDMYTRAYQLGLEYSDMMGHDVVFAAAGRGQVRLWQAWGMGPETVPSGKVSESELLDLLIFGESNLSPGLLRRSDGVYGDGQWALLDRHLMPEVITFVGKMGREGRDIRQLPPVQVFDPRARRRGEFKTIALNNVVGIMMVEEDMDFETMKQLARPIEDRYAHLMNVVGRENRPRLVFLTPSLFEHWRSGGFWATGEQVMLLDKARRREYGFGPVGPRTSEGEQGIFYTAPYSGPKIGGSVRALVERKKEGDSLVLLDAGMQFGEENRPDRIRYEDMLITALRNREMGMWAGVISPEALLYSTRIISGLMARSGADKDPLCAFVASELVANLSEDKIRAILGDRVGQIVVQIGTEHVGAFGDPNMKAVHIMSHVHVDHTSKTQNIRAEIPLLLTLASLVMAEARDDLNPVYAEILNCPRWWEGKPGKATPRDERDVVVMRDGEIYAFGDTRIQLYGVEHSTIGAVGRTIEFSGLTVADPGDFRWYGKSLSAGSKTEAMVEQWAKKGIDWLVLEATGIRPGVNVSARDWRRRLERAPRMTDDDISAGVAEILMNPEHQGDTVIVYSSPYDLERNLAAMKAVAVSGRESVLGVRHAMIASRYEHEQRLLGNEAARHQGFDLEIPEYGLFVTEGSKKRTGVSALKMELSGRGVPVYDRYNILSGQGGRVIFLNPFGNEILSLDNLPLQGDLQVIWSTSIMYSLFDLKHFLKNKASIFMQYTNAMWAEPNFWTGGRLPFAIKHPKKGVLHRSGHSTPLELLKFLSYFEHQRLNILLHHTEKPGQAAQFIKEAFPKADWKIIDNLPHQDMTKMPSPDRRWMGSLLRLDK